MAARCVLVSPEAEAVTLIEDRTRAATAPARIRFLITALEIRAVEGRPGGFARRFTPVGEPTCRAVRALVTGRRGGRAVR
ncbi:hypothetical protein GCM10010313_83340 [Streptomyces violarus]|nr:hypothetical protein GCM10010313_83340 [Streptomyces violarus]